MKCKTSILWWLVNDKKHRSLTDGDMKIASLMPLATALFPGINYFSISGFNQVMHKCVVPAVKKRFPDLVTVPEDSVASNATTEITELLPSNGYEWTESDEWWSRFKQLLAA